MRSKLWIIGAGSLGKIYWDYAKLCEVQQDDWELSGFLDADLHAMDNEDSYPNVFDDFNTFKPEGCDLFICSIADVRKRKDAIMIMSKKGATFVSLIHPMANINRTARIGRGSFIGAFATVSVNSTIGDHVTIQDHCNIGHDSVVGDYSHLYVKSVLSGINTIEESVSVFTGAVVYPRITLQSFSVIGAGSVVMRRVKTGVTVLGNPAKPSPL